MSDEDINKNTEKPPRVEDDLPTEEEVEAEAIAESPWPLSIFKVAKVERPKFIRMASMFFFIAYIYSVLRDTKDAVVIERQSPTSINFLKTLFVTPFSIIAVMIIQKWLSFSTVSRILKGMTLIFGIYFLLYGSVILFFQEKIEPGRFKTIDALGDGKWEVRGLEFAYAFLLTLNFWTSSLLYVTSEMWGNLILSLLFMSYSNDICPFKQSLRFVPLFYIFSNVGLFFSGLTMLAFCHIQDNWSFTYNKYVINFIFIVSGFICVLIWLLQLNLESSILSKPIYKVEGAQKKKKSKPKVGFIEGFSYIFRSKLLFWICSIVLGYNISANLVDQIFKIVMKVAADKENVAAGSYVMRTQAYNQITIALLVILILVTPMAQSVQLLGWRFVGSLTPLWAIIGSSAVYLSAIYNTSVLGQNYFSFLNSMLGGRGWEDYIVAEKWIDQVVVGGFKVAKYAFFDIAKEAISMRINRDDRAFYKSIYDGICGKLGKSGGSIISIGLTGIMNARDVRMGSQFFFLMSGILCLAWLYGVFYLGRKYNESIEKNSDIDLDLWGKKAAKANS